MSLGHVRNHLPILVLVFTLLALFLIPTTFRFITQAATTSTTITALEDTYVRKSNPTTAYGSDTTLKIEAASNDKRALLRFITALPADAVVTKLQLKLYATNGSATGGSLYEVSGSWTQQSTTWNTTPAIGAKIMDFPKVSTKSWMTVDLPLSAVSSNQQYNWYITTTNKDAVYYASRETGTPPTIIVEYTIGVTPPVLTPTPTIAIIPTATPTIPFIPTATPVPSGDNPVIVAAGDIACDPASSSFNDGNGSSSSCHMKATADLISAQSPAAVLPLGDIQYYCGSYAAFMQSYDLSWGLFKSITYPAVGNHEYLTNGGSSPATGCDSSNTDAMGYFTYFGAAAGEQGKGYYSHDVGNWHLIALNTNCSSAGGCGTTSPQYQWLQNDLQTHPNACVLAYYHIPLFSSGGRANQNSKSLFKLLYDNNADLVLTGHDHTYERFAPQTAEGVLDTARGIRSFVVGTGGANHTSFTSTAPNSEVRNADSFGILKLTLQPDRYDWQFIPEPGKTFTDSGTQMCH